MSAEDRDRLLLASLPHVTFDGWGPEAFRHGAESIGLDPEMADELLPGGTRGRVVAFSDWADRAMLAGMTEEELQQLGVTAKIALAVRLRFMALAPHQEAVRRSLAVLAQPGNAISGLTALHRTSDAIWNAIGDTSTDHNWYSKRMLLGGVISATTLYWLDDSSEDKRRTWAFLDRRLQNVVKVGGRLGRAVEGCLSLPDRVVRRMQARRNWGRAPR